MNSLLLCVLFSLVNAGLCLQCILCNSTSSNCSGVVEICPTGKICLSTITQSTSANGIKTQTFERSCGDASHCNTSASMTSLLSTETNSMCCSTDSCTPPTPTIIGGKKVQNDAQCPVCLAHNQDKCSSPEFRNCTGDERFCAEYVVVNDNERTIIMGCASENFCQTAQGQKVSNGKVIKVSSVCLRSGSSRLTYQNLVSIILLFCQMVSVAIQTA